LPQSFKKILIIKALKVQEVWDSKGMSIDLQDYVLKKILGTFLINNNNLVDFKNEDGLGTLITEMPSNWIVAFDYLPIVDQLSSIMKFETLCYKMLTMWRNQLRWLTTNETLQCITYFLGGKKVREYWDFIIDNLHCQWELPITYPNIKY